MPRRIHFWIFALVIAVAPLPLGANRPWAWTPLAVAIAILCLTWPLVARLDRDYPPPRLGLVAGPLILVGLVMTWGALQAWDGLPLAWAHPIWDQMNAALALTRTAEPVPATVSVVPQEVGTALLRLLLYVGCIWLAFVHGRSPRRARRLVEVIAASGLVYALHGLFVYATGNGTVFNRPKLHYLDLLSGSFINPNHYATYAGLTALALLATMVIRLGSRGRALLGPIEQRDRVTVLFVVALLCILVALGASRSRAGISSSVLGMATFGICAWVWSAPRPRLNRALKALVPLILIPAAIASVAIANVDLMTGSTHRAYVWGLTLDMIGDRPFLGTGMNSFAGMFASVRPNDLTQLWTKAHDTYLELALDLGIPAAGLLIGAALWLCILCARGVLTRDRDQVLPALGFSATILVGFHALADFSMQIPAVAMTWSVLVGVGVAQSISSRSRRTDARPIEFAGAPAAQGTAKSSALPP